MLLQACGFLGEGERANIVVAGRRRLKKPIPLTGTPLWLMSRKSLCGTIVQNTCLLARVRDLAIVDTSGNLTLSAGAQKVICILCVPTN